METKTLRIGSKIQIIYEETFSRAIKITHHENGVYVVQFGYYDVEKKIFELSQKPPKQYKTLNSSKAISEKWLKG